MFIHSHSWIHCCLFSSLQPALLVLLFCHLLAVCNISLFSESFFLNGDDSLHSRSHTHTHEHFTFPSLAKNQDTLIKIHFTCITPVSLMSARSSISFWWWMLSECAKVCCSFLTARWCHCDFYIYHVWLNEGKAGSRLCLSVIVLSCWKWCMSSSVIVCFHVSDMADWLRRFLL